MADFISGESLPDYKILNWVAQCNRRIVRPLDSSERNGLSAFEYGWKAVNALYKPFAGDSETKKLRACLDTYLDGEVFIKRAKADIFGLCGDFLSDDLTIPPSPADAHDTALQAKRYAKSLKAALKNNNGKAIYLLAHLLYIVRNARVHADLYMGSSAMVSASGRTIMKSPFHHLPSITLELCIHLLCGKTKASRPAIQKLVKARTDQLLAEIKSNLAG